MMTGDIVRMASCKVTSRDADGKMRSEITYSAVGTPGARRGKRSEKRDFIFLLLGTQPQAGDFDEIAMLVGMFREMGWTIEPPPELLAQIAKLKEEGKR